MARLSRPKSGLGLASVGGTSAGLAEFPGAPVGNATPARNTTPGLLRNVSAATLVGGLWVTWQRDVAGRRSQVGGFYLK